MAGITSALPLVYCRLRRLWLCRIFPHHLTNGTVLGRKFSTIKCVFSYSLQFLSEKVSRRRIQEDMIDRKCRYVFM